jgi:DNA invertase Pin-like site-specific DNA recombinase
MTTAIYARISDDRRDGVGVENQLRTCREWCVAEGWAPAVEYVDNDISASVYARKPRKAYQGLLRAVEEGTIDRIVVFAVDRLFRQVRELETLIPLAEKVEVRSKVGGMIDLSTAGGRMNARQQTTWASYESEVRSERVRLAQQRNREKGDPHGGPRPFGWLAIAVDGRNGGRSWDPRQHDPAEAALIRQAAGDVLAGATVTGIAKAWNAAKVPQTRGGQGWHPATITAVLRSPRNAGLAAYKGSITPGDWPAILEQGTWERVCAELDDRRSRFTTVRRRRSLLSGILVCSRCGVLLMHGRTRGTVTYRCKAGPGSAGCGRIQIAAEPLERDIAEALIRYLDTTDLAKLSGAAQTSEAATLTSELGALEVEARETADLAAAGTIRPADFARYSSGIEARRRALRQRLARLSSSSSLEPFAGKVGALRARWPAMSDDQRRMLIGAAFGRLTVEPAAGATYDFSRVREEAVRPAGRSGRG